MIITLSWHLGAWKSTLWVRLAHYYWFEKYSTGDFMRELATEKWITLYELWLQAEKDGWVIDSILDERQKKLWEEEDNFIIDGRLSFHFIPKAIKIFLTIEPIEAARRIFLDKTRAGVEIHESAEHAAENIILRRKSEDERYMKYYWLHIYDMSFYDFVIDTTHKDPNEVFEEVMKYIDALQK